MFLGSNFTCQKINTYLPKKPLTSNHPSIRRTFLRNFLSFKKYRHILC
jgi:hypothetical protein